MFKALLFCFPHSSISKKSACNAGDPGANPGLGRSPGEENGNPLQYPCQENPMDVCDTLLQIRVHVLPVPCIQPLGHFP